jgi:hypothetical protein
MTIRTRFKYRQQRLLTHGPISAYEQDDQPQTLVDL